MLFLGLCPDCSAKLNYFSKKREIKRVKRKYTCDTTKKKHKSQIRSNDVDKAGPSAVAELEEPNQLTPKLKETLEESPWENVKYTEAKSRDEEMEDYLQDLLL